MQSFHSQYNDKVRQALQKQFNYSNPMEIPKIEKIIVNMGVGEVVQNSKVIDHAVNDLTLITGQKPVVCKAKKSVSTFKLREGMPIGCKVTLRKQRMYDFLERLVICAMPRIRDFRGLSAKSFDGRGNFSMGIKEQIVFPEINYDKIDTVRGLDITIVTTAKTDIEAKHLLMGFHFPFIN